MKKSRYIYLTIGIIITILIFTNSLMPSNISSEQSGLFVNIAKKILTFLNISYDHINLDFYVRKAAHMTQFFLFAFSFFMFFYLSEREPYEPFILTLNYSLLTALTDELIQYFTPGRAMQVEDIFIDLTGALIFLLIAAIIISLKKLKIKAKP